MIDDNISDINMEENDYLDYDDDMDKMLDDELEVFL